MPFSGKEAARQSTPAQSHVDADARRSALASVQDPIGPYPACSLSRGSIGSDATCFPHVGAGNRAVMAGPEPRVCEQLFGRMRTREKQGVPAMVDPMPRCGASESLAFFPAWLGRGTPRPALGLDLNGPGLKKGTVEEVALFAQAASVRRTSQRI